MTKNQQLLEKIAVTFVEAGLSYLAINQTNLSGNIKLTAIGVLGAGLSAVYNLLRQSQPSINITNQPIGSGLPPLPTDIPKDPPA